MIGVIWQPNDKKSKKLHRSVYRDARWEEQYAHSSQRGI